MESSLDVNAQKMALIVSDFGVIKIDDLLTIEDQCVYVTINNNSYFKNYAMSPIKEPTKDDFSDECISPETIYLKKVNIDNKVYRIGFSKKAKESIVFDYIKQLELNVEMAKHLVNRLKRDIEELTRLKERP